MAPAKVNQKYEKENGRKYYGEFNENSVRHGYGLEISETGDKYYEGEWANGLRSGKGGVVIFGVLEYLGDFLND